MTSAESISIFQYSKKRTTGKKFTMDLLGFRIYSYLNITQLYVAAFDF